MQCCMTKWRALGPSAQLIVDPASGTRGIIRDTRAEGAYRFHWSVIPSEEPLPSPPGALEGSHGRGRSPSKRFAPMPQTSAYTPRQVAQTFQCSMHTREASWVCHLAFAAPSWPTVAR